VHNAAHTERTHDPDHERSSRTPILVPRAPGDGGVRAMQDYVASFYGGYDAVLLRRSARHPASWIGIAIVSALIVLMILVVADVSAYENRPVVVRITSIGWYAEGYLLTSTSGFPVHPSEAVVLSLFCDGICLPWSGATVSAPFGLLSFSVVYDSAQYTNVTVRAPATAYEGPLAVTLDLPG